MKQEWDGRLLAERSLAIKCPTVAYQLVGAKKVQQVLAAPGQLERFVKDPQSAALLRASFTGLYPLDHTPEGLAAYEAALVNSDELVMKPQREGGGTCSEHYVRFENVCPTIKPLANPSPPPPFFGSL